MDDLLALVRQIVPYHMGHNAETDAVDLLLEVPGGRRLPLAMLAVVVAYRASLGLGPKLGSVPWSE